MALTLKKKPTLAKPGGLKRTTLTKPGKASEFGASGPKTKVKKGGAFDKADEAIKKAEHKRSLPYRASIPVGSTGVEAYFLDRGEPFFMYEHSLGGSKTKPGTQYPCIKDTNENCPGCNVDPKGEGYYIMLLTAVIPKLTVTTKDGEEKTYHWQKKEWPVKIKMVKKYQRLYQAHGGFRGMVVSVSRDGKMDPATGNDIEFVRMMSEKEIKKFASNPKYAEAKLDQPIDFEKVHKLPSAAELAKLIGANANAAGSADFGKEDDDDGDFEAGGFGWGDD